MTASMIRLETERPVAQLDTGAVIDPILANNSGASINCFFQLLPCFA